MPQFKVRIDATVEVFGYVTVDDAKNAVQAEELVLAKLSTVDMELTVKSAKNIRIEASPSE